MDASQLEALKNRVEKARIAKIRAEAAYEEAQARLKELGFDNIEAAEEALDSLYDQRQQLEADYNKLMADIAKKYPKLVEE